MVLSLSYHVNNLTQSDAQLHGHSVPIELHGAYKLVVGFKHCLVDPFLTLAAADD